MIPVVRTYRKSPGHLHNCYNHDTYGGRMENYNQKVNVAENENEFTLEVVVPGYSKEEVKVTIENNELTVASNNKEEESKRKFVRHEFSKKPFSRTFELPENVELEKIGASHKNGILTISIPKKAKVEIPVQEIPVK